MKNKDMTGNQSRKMCNYTNIWGFARNLTKTWYKVAEKKYLLLFPIAKSCKKFISENKNWLSSTVFE